MLSRIHITCLLGIAVAVWGASLLVLGLPLSWDYAAPFALTVSVLTAASVLFDKYLWRLSIFRGWLVRQPDIQGSWRARLGDGSSVDGVMVIRQTFSRVSARLYTKESNSRLIAHSLTPQDDDHLHQLVGVYQNVPDVTLRGVRSEIHYGTFLVEVRGDPPTSLTGHYWTDRQTRGVLELTDRTKELLSSYEAPGNGL